MMTALKWIMGTRLGKWVAMICAVLAMLAGAVLVGWTKRGQVEAGKALEGYKATRKAVDDEDYLDGDLGLVRDRLRERGKR